MRIEVGPKDIKNKGVTICMRDLPKNKQFVHRDSLVENIRSSFSEQLERLYKNAFNNFVNSISVARTWGEFMSNLNAGKMVLAPFKDDKANEEVIKDKSKGDTQESSMSGSAKSLNFPLDEELESLGLGISNGDEMECISNELTGQNNRTTTWCLFGRS